MPHAATKTPIHVVHTIGNIGVNVGGPARTVPALCRHVNETGGSIQCEIVTTRDGPFGNNLDTPGVAAHTVPYRAGSHAFRKLLEDHILDVHRRSPDAVVIIHDHGQWLATNRAAAAVSAKHQLTRIVSPRGMLTPWARRHRYWKKQVAWHLFAGRDLRVADALHATSAAEASDLRQVGARQPIVNIPNGVEPWMPAHSEGPLHKSQTVMFLSRIHVKKGVLELVAAWRAVRPAGWRLVLAGPDEGRLVSALQLTADDTVDYVGPLDGEAKWRALQGAGVVILPSHSENFGIVVAEALMAGTPVITTHGTPWSGVQENRCGWWIPLTQAALRGAIAEATSLDAGELAAMGANGRAWVTSAFSWHNIGREMAGVYRWLANGGQSPACLVPG